MAKIIIWGIVGVLVYLWLRKKLGLDKGDTKETTVHHHHYNGDKNKKPSTRKDDYIDYEEIDKP